MELKSSLLVILGSFSFSLNPELLSLRLLSALMEYIISSLEKHPGADSLGKEHTVGPSESPYRPVFGFRDRMKKGVGGEKSMVACLV